MKGFVLEVAGPFACFTRPEMKVERVSYDIITPSAARAIFEAILWKPAIRWRVLRIEVLSPISWIAIRRNEVGKVASVRGDGLFIEDERQQRAGLLLRNVRYRLHAEFDFIPPPQRAAIYNPVPEWLNSRNGDEELLSRTNESGESAAKYAAMFERRAKKGQCFHQPYLGCREFACEFKLVDQAIDFPRAIDESRDLGWTLYDIDFTDALSSRPMFFRPVMKQGVVDIPHPNSEEVKR